MVELVLIYKSNSTLSMKEVGGWDIDENTEWFCSNATHEAINEGKH